MDLKLKPVVRTKDLSESASLLTCGHQLAGLEWSGTFFWFLFEETPELIRDSELFWQGHLTGDLKSFSQNLRFLKDRIHRGSTQGGNVDGKQNQKYRTRRF